MLSSFFKRKGGKQQNNQQGQQNQPGKQKQSTPQVYIPAKFHGEITANDHVLVENPKTFEVPIGVSVDPIFESYNYKNLRWEPGTPIFCRHINRLACNL